MRAIISTSWRCAARAGAQLERYRSRVLVPPPALPPHRQPPRHREFLCLATLISRWTLRRSRPALGRRAAPTLARARALSQPQSHPRQLQYSAQLTRPHQQQRRGASPHPRAQRWRLRWGAPDHSPAVAPVVGGRQRVRLLLLQRGQDQAAALVAPLLLVPRGRCRARGRRRHRRVARVSRLSARLHPQGRARRQRHAFGQRRERCRGLQDRTPQRPLFLQRPRPHRRTKRDRRAPSVRLRVACPHPNRLRARVGAEQARRARAH